MSEPHHVPTNPRARAELLREVEHHPMHAGIVVRYPGGITARLAHAGGFNLRWKEALLDEVRPHAVALQAQGEDTSDDLAFAILARAYARAVVLELSGPEVPAAGDVDAVSAWLLADRELFEDWIAIAEDPSNYPTAGLKEARVYGDAEGFR